MNPTATLSPGSATPETCNIIRYTFPAQAGASFVLGLADAADREEIVRRRHEIYARELGQHAVNLTGALRDPLDAVNIYLTARCAGEIAGFISLTPPTAPAAC